MVVGGDIAVLGEDEAAARAGELPLDRLAEDVVAHGGGAGGVDADAAVHVGVVDLGEGEGIAAGDADGLHLGQGALADHHLGLAPAVPAVQIPSGAEAAANEERAAQDQGHGLAGPVLFLGGQGHGGLLGLEAAGVGTVAVVILVVASVLVIIIVIHKMVLLMVSPFSASAAGGALDGGRIPKIYDKNMKKLRKDFKHSKDIL